MIRTPGRDLVCVFGKESWQDEQFLYICDQCGFAVCSDHSEWVKVDSGEMTGFTHPCASSEGWHVRVCLGCINPGLTYREWFDHVVDVKHMRTVEGTIVEVKRGEG